MGRCFRSLMVSPRDVEPSAPADAGAEQKTKPLPAVYAYAAGAGRVDPDAVKVIRRLTRHGHEAYLVGGGVRDLLLGKQPKDFDVATSALPQEVRRLFRNCRIIGRRFRLAHILFGGGKVIEVATFRKDIGQRYVTLPVEPAQGMELRSEEEPTRIVPVHEDVSEEDLLIRSDNIFGSPHQDAMRRDFTINGLFYDLERAEVIDYVGGVPDLQRRMIATIGDPLVRFQEDPVRLLRAIKFAARLDLGVHPEVYDAIVALRSELGRAAKPRVFEEILRLMRGGAAHRSIYLAWELGVLAEILPEVAAYLDDEPDEAERTWRRLLGVDRMHERGRLPSDAVLMAALLFGPIQEMLEGVRDVSRAFDEGIEELALRLTLPRRLRDRIRMVILSQARLRSGRLGALPRRDFFPEAAQLFAIDCEARGEALPEWATPTDGELPKEPSRRRRRRRRPAPH